MQSISWHSLWCDECQDMLAHLPFHLFPVPEMGAPQKSAMSELLIHRAILVRGLTPSVLSTSCSPSRSAPVTLTV